MKKLTGKILIGVVVLIVLAALWLVQVHHRARTVLEAYRKQLATQGEKLTIAEVAPHLTADEQMAARNLLTSITYLGAAYSNSPPSMKVLAPGHALVSWAEESLPTAEATNLWPGFHAYFLAHEQRLDALKEALKQPVGEVRLDYTQGIMLLLPHLAPAKQAAVQLSAAARLELHEGRTDEAGQDLRACVSLGRLLEHEPLQISQLVRVAIYQVALGGTWEALQSTNWQDKQLAEMQASWESVDVLNGVAPSIEMERAILPFTFAELRRGDHGSGTQTGSSMMDVIGRVLANPKEGYEEFMENYVKYWAWKWQWSYDEELFNMQMFQAALDASRKLKGSEALFPVLKEYDAAEAKIREQHRNIINRFVFGPDGGVARSYLRKLVKMEVERRLLVTAIALKRFQLAHGKYPAELSKLTPAFLPAVPLDAMDGKPLRYHAKPDGTFLLYSVGEDGVDNGGDPTPTSKSTMWTETKDIVWPMPATAEEVGVYKKKMIDEWNAKHAKRK